MNNKEKIKSEAQRIEEDSLYSAKGHFYAAQFWVDINLWLGGVSAVLSGIAGASALSEFDYHNIVAGVISLVVAALTAVITFVNPNEKAASHQKAGNKYSALRSEVRIFYNLETGTLDDKSMVDELKKLNPHLEIKTISTGGISIVKKYDIRFSCPFRFVRAAFSNADFFDSQFFLNREAGTSSICKNYYVSDPTKKSKW